MKKHIAPFKANTTHITTTGLYTNSQMAAWWVINGMPKLQKYVVIECHEVVGTCDQDAISWLMERGVKMVQVIIKPRPVVEINEPARVA